MWRGMLLFFFIIALSSCELQIDSSKNENNEGIVLLFQHYHPHSFQTLGGLKHIPLPKVLYTDSVGDLVKYAPREDTDTLILYTSDTFKELALNYGDFEYIYFFLMPGDTISISLDSIDYPVLNSRHYPEHDRVYNLNRELRKGRTHEGLEAKTCLGSDWVRIAQNIDMIREKRWARLLMDYCPLDSLQFMFSSYQSAYMDTIQSYLKQTLISHDVYQRHKYILELKKHEAQRMLNEDTLYYAKMETGISDNFLSYPSYYAFLEHYIWFVHRRASKNHYPDWRATFDRIALKPFQAKSKQILLSNCMDKIGELCSAKDIQCYLDNYLRITQDTSYYEHVKEKYNLSADSSQLLLEDMKGSYLTLNQLLHKYKGKVIYVDFWASWCRPCCEELKVSVHLRDAYKDKDVVFVYLAFNDSRKAWKEFSRREGLADIETNYFITNSKNSNLVETLELKQIPRYVIFDKQGNLVEMNAPRPSNHLLMNTLNIYID